MATDGPRGTPWRGLTFPHSKHGAALHVAASTIDTESSRGRTFGSTSTGCGDHEDERQKITDYLSRLRATAKEERLDLNRELDDLGVSFSDLSRREQLLVNWAQKYGECTALNYAIDRLDYLA